MAGSEGSTEAAVLVRWCLRWSSNCFLSPKREFALIC